MTDESGRVCSSCGQEPRPGVYENPDLTYCPECGMPTTGASQPEPLAAYDLRLRSLDREVGEPIWLCSRCSGFAHWSVWLHTPEWGSQGGLTLVLCTPHARLEISREIREATASAPEGE